jgi:hypothetical protein
MTGGVRITFNPLAQLTLPPFDSLPSASTITTRRNYNNNDNTGYGNHENTADNDNNNADDNNNTGYDDNDTYAAVTTTTTITTLMQTRQRQSRGRD